MIIRLYGVTIGVRLFKLAQTGDISILHIVLSLQCASNIFVLKSLSSSIQIERFEIWSHVVDFFLLKI